MSTPYLSHLIGNIVDFTTPLSFLLLSKLNFYKFDRKIHFGVLLSIVSLITVVLVRYPLPLYWWGSNWDVSIYYFVSVLALYLFLRVDFHSFKAITASLFTVFMSSVVWEFPTFFIWHNWLIFDIYLIVFQVTILSLLFLSWKVFKLNKKALILFIPLFLILIPLAYLSGNPTTLVSTFQHQFLGWSRRIISLVSLTYIMWIKGDKK